MPNGDAVIFGSFFSYPDDDKKRKFEPIPLEQESVLKNSSAHFVADLSASNEFYCLGL